MKIIKITDAQYEKITDQVACLYEIANKEEKLNCAYELIGMLRMIEPVEESGESITGRVVNPIYTNPNPPNTITVPLDNLYKYCTANNNNESDGWNTWEGFEG